MSPRRRKTIPLRAHGLISSAHNPEGIALSNFVDLPKRLIVEHENGELRCRKQKDSLGDSTGLFTAIPTAQIPSIRRKAQQRGSAIRLKVSYETPPFSFERIDKSDPDAEFLNFIASRAKPSGLIQQWDGISGFGRRLASLMQRWQNARIAVVANQKLRLEELNTYFASVGKAVIPIVNRKRHTPPGVSCLAMTAMTYFSRNRYVAGIDEFSITGLEAFHFVFYLDPQENIGPFHDSKMRVTLVSSGAHSTIGVITRRSKTLRNELEVLKKYFGEDILSLYAEPRRNLTVWSLYNTIFTSVSRKYIITFVQDTVIFNTKRNLLVAKIAMELVERRWPFNNCTQQFECDQSCVSIVTFNTAHKAEMERILLQFGYSSSTGRWSHRAGKYIKLFTLTEFSSLCQLPSACVINADGRGIALKFPGRLLRSTPNIPNEIHLIEFTDFSGSLRPNVVKDYSQATAVRKVSIRAGKLRNRSR